MVRFEPFQVGDILHLDVQAKHAFLVPYLTRRIFEVQLATEGAFSYTAWTPYGGAVACCGILDNHHAWALLGGDLKRYAIPVTRMVHRVLQDHKAAVGPVYADIDTAHEDAVKWATLLGFTPTSNPSKWICE